MPGAPSIPLAEMMEQWVMEALQDEGYPRPACKQVALVLTGLVAGEPATVSGLSRTLASRGLAAAQEPSITRRLLRLLAEHHLDPDRLLPAIFRRYLPELLAGLVAAHTANMGCSPVQHARFRPVRLVVDETSQDDAVHLLVIGLWYQGMVLPVAVRAWPQNTPLPPDAYWSALGSLCWEVHTLLPPVLRDHVLLLADRGYDTPRLLDVLNGVGWAWVLRSNGQVQVQQPDGTTCPLRTLVPAPGRSWACRRAWPEADRDPEAVLGVFRKAGWRSCRVVGVWLPGQSEPWLLLTNLPARRARLAEYAQRWAIERLFLAWKSHGWQLEAGRIRDAVRLGRLASGLVLATWWHLACAQPVADAELERLAGRPLRGPRQLALPFAGPTAARPDRRPWAAKFSLLTWGRRAVQAVDCATSTPPLDWTFPNWAAPSWPRQCELALLART